SNENVRSRYLVKYTQAYYTVDVDQPRSPADTLADDVSFAQLKAHVPPEQTVPDAQTLSQLPQWAKSVLVSKQLPSQSVVPFVHDTPHVPPEQT
ncbi:MAG TPA: thiol-activated cytolysin family protein, partial [Polyangiaceae bacterium]|nr:thiol-activated cytolysin family protein [Polyangiaceae bacterium]